MALRMGIMAGRSVKRVTIFADNQAAIRAIESPSQQSGQSILFKTEKFLRILSSRGVQVNINWICAHKGVPGNERVDRLAKEATGWRASGQHRLPVQAVMEPFVLKACRKRDYKRLVYDMWANRWPGENTGVLYRKYFGDTLDKNTGLLYKGLDKALASILIQMRTGKIGLNSYLHKIRRVERPWCECQQLAFWNSSGFFDTK